MTGIAASLAEWTAANQRDLAAALDRVRVRLAEHVGASAGPSDAPAGPAGPGDPAEPQAEPADPQADPVEPGYALGTLAAIFDLSPFERDVLVLCAGVELDARFGDLVIAARGGAGPPRPTFGLALAALPGAHWSAVTPTGPLRGWRLVELDGSSITGSGLRLDERVLHFLVGMNQLDDRLRDVLAPADAWTGLSARALTVATAIGEALAADDAWAMQVIGADVEERAAVATAAGAVAGATVLRLRDADLPERTDERFALARLCAREWRLARGVVAVDVAGEADGNRLAAFAAELAAPLLVCAREPIPSLAGRAPAFEVPAPSREERLEAWREAIGPPARRLNGALDRAAAQFDLGRGAMRLAAAHAPELDADGEALWDACRVASRPRMGGLAQRIDAAAGWDDLVLPAPQLAVLRAIAAQVRQRHRVYEEWGFAARSSRGLGISALFVGESGTGKTMAAEVLARELRLDLYRIDLASVVSKYIGETERNLRQLFDAAEGSGAILLFDEADALFGRRSEVRDSHDRYANVEISYLLQRMEAYRGLAILTTNMKQALDPAFLRRIRFVVRFPFPDAGQRAAIWRGIFPEPTPTGVLDYEQLGQLTVSGGHIRNIAMAGAFLAADGDEPVGMAHLAAAARAEYVKLERSLSEVEMRGWP